MLCGVLVCGLDVGGVVGSGLVLCEVFGKQGSHGVEEEFGGFGVLRDDIDGGSRGVSSEEVGIG